MNNLDYLNQLKDEANDLMFKLVKITHLRGILSHDHKTMRVWNARKNALKRWNRRLDKYHAEANIQQWNSLNPVGSLVSLTDSQGAERLTRTISPAMVYAKTKAVVWLAGVIGFVELRRLAGQ